MSKESNILTIAIPTFNRPFHIQNAIESIVKQYRDGVDILISDNSENEDTSKIVKEKFSKLSYTKYVKNSINIGPDANFLQCLNLAKGKFVLILSDDDMLLEGALDEIIDIILDFPNIPIIYLNHYSWEGPISRKLTPRIPIEVNQFISNLSYDLTLVSAIVFNKNKFLEIKDSSRFIGSYLLQTGIAMEMIGRDGFGMITGKVCLSVQKTSGEFGRYDVYQVFAINWKDILLNAYHNGYIHRSTVRKAYSRTIFPFLTKATLGWRHDETINQYVKNKKLLFKVTKFYLNAWLFLYPAAIAPKFLISLLFKFRSRLSKRDL